MRWVLLGWEVSWAGCSLGRRSRVARPRRAAGLESTRERSCELRRVWSLLPGLFCQIIVLPTS